MKLVIATTPDHDAAIAILNQQSNAGGIVPPDDEFATSLLLGTLDGLVKQVSAQSAADTLAVLTEKFDQLSDEDKATIAAIADTAKGIDANALPAEPPQEIKQ